MNGLVFLHPWILGGLAALPLLWLLLRIMPPAPRRIVLPTARFLDGLIPDRPFPSRTPWWILLIRMLVLALVLLALAGPVLHPTGGIPGKGTLRLLIDTGWEAAQTWSLQMGAARDLLAQAERENRPVILSGTARTSADRPPDPEQPSTAAAARAALAGLRPLPWPADYEALEKTLRASTQDGGIETVFLSAGLGAPEQAALYKTLQTQGSLSVVLPGPESLPVLLVPAPAKESSLAPAVRAIVPEGFPAGVPLSVQALDSRGRVLDSRSLTSEPGQAPVSVSFEISDSRRNDLARIQIVGRSGAGGLLLADERFRRRTAGILTSTEESSESTPLVGEAYYLKRALEPYATLTLGNAEALLKAGPSLILVPDRTALPSGDLDRLDAWIRAGGTLMRFAGPKLAAAGGGVLLPLDLRAGDRSMGGGMSWTKPASLGLFPTDSPFADLAVPADVSVRRQVLAQETDDPSVKVWMRLSDGTPLLTARSHDRGLIVLLHTTAGPEWSDLALSGLYVDLLRRIVSLSAAPAAAFAGEEAVATILQPREVLDGTGRLVKPGPDVKPISASAFETTSPSPDHPPGLYGNSSSRALNLGERISSLSLAGPFPSGVETRAYHTQRHETNLAPPLLTLAFCLFLMDWTIALFLSGLVARMGRLRQSRRLAALILLAALLSPWAGEKSALAQTPENASPISASSVRQAAALHLAWVRSGDPGVDRIAEEGLRALAETLRLRTSVAPEGVVGVDPESDDLSFFPLLYWPVSAEARPLPSKAVAAIQTYLDLGGTILFDTRDQGFSVSGFEGTANARALRRMVGLLDVPGLVPVPQGHVIGKSFYLLEDFPGRYEGGMLWVEAQSVSGRDGVSSILIGANDWAGAWAEQSSDPADRRNELAMRFGVNLVMYALTGNYKADQVHVPHILERLGKRSP